jgi:hypothetical protein
MNILRQKKVIVTAIIPLALIIALAFASYAAPIPVQTVNLNGLAGITYNIATPGFTFSNPAYTVTLADKSASATWVNNGKMNSALFEGRWQFEVTLTADTALSSAAHTATLLIDKGNGYVTIGTISFTSAVASGEKMTLIFGTGWTDLPESSAIVITLT